MAKIRELRLLTGGGAAACVSNSTWWLQPILMQQFVSTTWLRRDTSLRRLANSAVMVTLLASIATLWAQEHYALLFCLRIIAGLGTGIALTVSNTLGAMSRAPDTMFAKYGLVNVVYGVVLLWALRRSPRCRAAAPTS